MPWSTDRYASAVRFAAERHAGQRYPGTDLPYLLHVVTVAAEVQRALVDEPRSDPDLAVVCALLHDTVEDTDTTAEDIAAAFGEATAAGVLALTKDAGLPPADRMPDSLRRIREQPPEIWMVKLADRIANLAEPPHFWPMDKRRAYLAEGELVAGQLAGVSAWLDRRIRERIARYPTYLR
jgi:guanosine-3',5'-bis(diphosphate) 3'-pyrophosphohydrolase